MPLRCLLFTTDEAQVAPILQVISELGLEGEHCDDPVIAVEKVTTQLFQILITNWQDQPEAAFLLKTARDLKASARPLTLAIVSDQERAQALQAGANSVLLKPLRPEQMRETIGTACELLRSKLQAPAPAAARAASISSGPAAGMAAAPARAPEPSTTATSEAPEKLRAGEFLQTAPSAPGAQFDTESEVRESIEASSNQPLDSLTDLEPTAASVQPVKESAPEPKEALTGWAALQARLNKNAPAPPPTVEPGNPLGFNEVPIERKGAPAVAEMSPAGAATKAVATKAAAKTEPDSSAELFNDPREEVDPVKTVPANRNHIKLLFACGFVLTCVFVVTLPRTRRGALVFFRNSIHAMTKWLNPPPATLPQAVAQHDSFAQDGDEYKLPAPANTPDVTTDSGQIQVVPVVDPTAKPDKTGASGAQSGSGDQAQATSAGTTSAGTTDQGASAPTPNQNLPAESGQPKDRPVTPVVPAATPTPASTSLVASAPPPPSAVAQPQAASTQTVVQTSLPPARVTAPQPITAPENHSIPASLQSQVAASAVPYSSGVKPDDTAMSSIEPVKLSEAAVRGLLTQQPPDPEYPAAAKASGQRGSVVLQVFIGRDGAVQDAKFLQGSFIFARAAIDAVRQWQFKPYSLNGRAVSVQSVITLNFKPSS